MPTPRRLDRFGYGAVAGVYETLARAYSLGRIQDSRRGQLAWLAPGARVLYAGVGPGEDALAAARIGVRVTAVDVSPAMLRRLARKLDREGLSADLRQGDVADHVPDEPYDAVVANYFLNLFDVDGARAMARRLASQLRPGGRLLLADFARPDGGRLARALTSAYYRPVNGLAWAARLCELHPIHDHRALLGSADLRVLVERRYPILPVGPAFVSIAAIRTGARGRPHPGGHGGASEGLAESGLSPGANGDLSPIPYGKLRSAGQRPDRTVQRQGERPSSCRPSW